MNKSNTVKCKVFWEDRNILEPERKQQKKKLQWGKGKKKKRNSVIFGHGLPKKASSWRSRKREKEKKRPWGKDGFGAE